MLQFGAPRQPKPAGRAIPRLRQHERFFGCKVVVESKPSPPKLARVAIGEIYCRAHPRTRTNSNGTCEYLSEAQGIRLTIGDPYQPNDKKQRPLLPTARSLLSKLWMDPSDPNVLCNGGLQMNLDGREWQTTSANC